MQYYLQKNSDAGGWGWTSAKLSVALEGLLEILGLCFAMYCWNVKLKKTGLHIPDIATIIFNYYDKRNDRTSITEISVVLLMISCSGEW